MFLFNNMVISTGKFKDMYQLLKIKGLVDQVGHFLQLQAFKVHIVYLKTNNYFFQNSN